MSSLSGSKDETPERRTEPAPEEEPEQPTTSTVQIQKSSSGQEETYDDEPDESLGERLWALTEMFPSPVRDFCGKVTDVSCSTVKLIFETERAQMEEMKKSQQKQVLLGPGSAGPTPAMPGIPR